MARARKTRRTALGRASVATARSRAYLHTAALRLSSPSPRAAASSPRASACRRAPRVPASRPALRRAVRRRRRRRPARGASIHERWNGNVWERPPCRTSRSKTSRTTARKRVPGATSPFSGGRPDQHVAAHLWHEWEPLRKRHLAWGTVITDPPDRAGSIHCARSCPDCAGPTS